MGLKVTNGYYKAEALIYDGDNIAISDFCGSNILWLENKDKIMELFLVKNGTVSKINISDVVIKTDKGFLKVITKKEFDEDFKEIQ